MREPRLGARRSDCCGQLRHGKPSAKEVVHKSHLEGVQRQLQTRRGESYSGPQPIYSTKNYAEYPTVSRIRRILLSRIGLQVNSRKRKCKSTSGSVSGSCTRHVHPIIRSVGALSDESPTTIRVGKVVWKAHEVRTFRYMKFPFSFVRLTVLLACSTSPAEVHVYQARSEV